MKQLNIVLLFTIGLFYSSYIYLTHIFQESFAKYIQTPPTNNTDYDFVVVGSGSAGSVVAGRLTEAGHSVLLVEAGGPSHWLQGIPGFVAHFMGSVYDWKYTVKDDRASRGLKDGMMVWPRGKSLGGSSMLNWMVYHRKVNSSGCV